MLRDGFAVTDDFLFWSLFTSFPHRKNLEQGYTNFIYKTFAFRVPWKKPQLFTGRIYAPTTEILFPTTNIKFLRLVVLVVGNKSSLFTERSKNINRLEELVFYSCVRNLIIQEYLNATGWSKDVFVSQRVGFGQGFGYFFDKEMHLYFWQYLFSWNTKLWMIL